MRTLGKNADGTLSVCKAKPENRGRGNCPHGEHLESDMDARAIASHNEKALERSMDSAPPVVKRTTPNPAEIARVTPNSIRSHPGGAALTREQFNEASISIAAAFPEKDWDAIGAFYRKMEERLSDKALSSNHRSAVANVASYLNSGDPTAKKVRAFLGKDVDTREFANLLVHNVRAMTFDYAWRNGQRGISMDRSVLTTLNNDMNKERYVASVLFFGGRCCYCNQAMRKFNGKDPIPDNIATGEHITPISPSDSGAVVGGTRYGNMALACHGCNEERGNQDLNEWVEKTQRISQENKGASLERIEAFRRFALYRDYTEEESRLIRAKVSELKQFAASKPAISKGKYSREDGEAISREFKVGLYDLQRELRGTHLDT